MSKPILWVELSKKQSADHLNEIAHNLRKTLEDWHVLVTGTLEGATEAVKMQAFTLKDAQEINFEELKQLISIP